MPGDLQPYVRCATCGTSRPANLLHNGVCRDHFCWRAKEVLEAARRHVCWWLRRYPQFATYRDDFFQEACMAGWVAAAHYDSNRGAKFHTFAFPRMKTAVRTFLALQGHNSRRLGERTLQLEAVAAPSTSADAAERPTLLREAVELAEAPFAVAGVSPRDARVLAFRSADCALEVAGYFAGVSRQRAHQVVERWRAGMSCR